MTDLNSQSTPKNPPSWSKNGSAGGWWDKYPLNPARGDPPGRGEKLERGLQKEEMNNRERGSMNYRERKFMQKWERERERERERAKPEKLFS